MRSAGRAETPAMALEDTIDDVAAGPAAMAGDGWSARQHGLAELIALDRYQRGKTLLDNPAKMFACLQIVPPGA